MLDNVAEDFEKDIKESSVKFVKLDDNSKTKEIPKEEPISAIVAVS